MENGITKNIKYYPTPPNCPSCKKQRRKYWKEFVAGMELDSDKKLNVIVIGNILDKQVQDDVNDFLVFLKLQLKLKYGGSDLVRLSLNGKLMGSELPSIEETLAEANIDYTENVPAEVKFAMDHAEKMSEVIDREMMADLDNIIEVTDNTAKPIKPVKIKKAKFFRSKEDDDE